MSLNQTQAMCMCLSLFRNHQQIKAMTQNQPLRQHQNIQAAHHLATFLMYHSLKPEISQHQHKPSHVLLQTVYSLQNA